MSQSKTIRDRVYQNYLEFLQTAEKKRRWSIFDDVPWDALQSVTATENNALRVELFCTEELYVPDYTSQGFELVRSYFGLSCFQACWALEESKHGLVFREYLSRSGLRSDAAIATMEASIAPKAWKLPFATPRRMACYGALQEAATYIAYRSQKDQAREAGDAVLETIFHLVGRDEAAHAGFYRNLIELEMADDRAATVADLATVFAGFKMPGEGLIANYQERLRDSGAGISPRTFLERVVQPLLTTLQITRQEFKQALKSHQLAAAAGDAGQA